MNPKPSTRTLTHAIYLCFVLGVFLPPLIIVAILLNYFNEDDVAGSWLHTHFAWQSQTFWKALIWYLIGLLLCLIAIGVIVIFAVYVWYLYRMIKGWIYLSDNLPMQTF
ncbi:MAG: hypothetical protein COV52_05720 [Gammaproteobacteria bacterium CG11_big_fil_rev_8_21_14_0_20_46_22]|nr:MAG: hypothetical protein COW05_07940 [Gammaproteobacteria bacterium CG12_big_fil_rev_8_21_14_0_65_46_12]PIR11003.1 MAG: hypothetical protein COV52_05720 [Gammaproteobacteria bacterium CG11_big_fil_rev_8_21_14_0_20_46_22]